MERFIKGDIVVIPFPFSNLSGSKRRPAFVLRNLGGDDIILCQITSQYTRDTNSVALKDSDMMEGNIVDSNIRPNRIFTADKNIILRKLGSVNAETIEKVVKEVIEIIRT